MKLDSIVHCSMFVLRKRGGFGRQACLEASDGDSFKTKVQPYGLAVACYGIMLGSLILAIFPALGFLTKPVILIVCGSCIYKLLQFDRWDQEIIHLPRFLRYVFYLIVELFVENFLVWMVSALDVKKMMRLNPLQDNVLLLVSKLGKNYPLIQRLLTFKWVHTSQFLSISIFVALSPVWYQVPYSGFQMMSRFLLTAAISRSIRCVCFMLTILPNPKPGCYLRRFPPVPKTLTGFISVGIQKLKGTGGCNDLIFSGHCSLWTLTPLLFHSYYQQRCCWLLWLALFQTSIRTVLEHHHYSVDMFLAVVITTLIWRELKWVCPQDTRQFISHNVSKTRSRIMTVFVASLLILIMVFVVLSGA